MLVLTLILAVSLIFQPKRLEPYSQRSHQESFPELGKVENFYQAVWLQTQVGIIIYFFLCLSDETSDFVHEGGGTCTTLSKAVNVLSHNSQARDFEVCLCGKALAGHGGTSIISACLPRVACVEITAPINKQSPSVEIFIQTELHPCGELSEHSSCTLKGYSESHIWARVHLEINGVPLTG